MNTQTNNDYQAGANAFGKAIAARLSEGAEGLPHDISERLKVARTQAVSKRSIASLQVTNAILSSGRGSVLEFGPQEDGFWNHLVTFLPLLALVVGLVSIAVLQDDLRASEIAEVDSELLTDELPPSAYLDSGFAQYLRVNQSNQ